MIEIYKWENIQHYFRDAKLILGNGSSIAIDKKFSYSSLIKHAESNNYLNDDIKELFNFFKTEDFEFILRIVWQAAKVNKTLRIEDDKTYTAYLNLRDSLIKTVRSIHPSYEEVLPHLPIIHKFIRNFRYIYTLNYDLILYWAIMYGNEKDDSYFFKDCFIRGEFRNNWEYLKQNYQGRKSIFVFYPHGSLLLARNINEKEYKISKRDDMSDLLNTILTVWESEEAIPLFVSEGTKDQKVNAIKNSNYLHTIFRETLGGYTKCIVIYGWSFDDRDIHILHALKRHHQHYIFGVSVYNNDQDFCNRVNKLLKQVFYNCKVYFFDSQSAGCWNNPVHEKIVF